MTIRTTNIKAIRSILKEYLQTLKQKKMRNTDQKPSMPWDMETKELAKPIPKPKFTIIARKEYDKPDHPPTRSWKIECQDWHQVEEWETTHSKDYLYWNIFNTEGFLMRRFNTEQRKRK